MIIAWLGWFGAGLYLLNHAWLAINHGHESRRYYLLNMIAAAVLVLSSAYLSSWQPVLTNAFWVGVSALALLHWPNKTSFGGSWLRERVLIWPIGVALVAGCLVAIAQPYPGASIVGWAGTALFSVAYLTFATGVIARRRFLAYNAVAAFSLVPILYLDVNYPVFFLEVVWGFISALGWLRAYRQDESSA